MTQNISSLGSSQSHLISHLDKKVDLSESTEKLKQDILAKGNLPYASCKDLLEILDELKTFPLGQFLIENQVLNGFWTAYALRHPERGRITGLNSESKSFTPLESFLLNQAPLALATQERFKLHKESCKSVCIAKDFLLASVPCGICDDLLSLDYSKTNSVEVFGIDLDPLSIELAQKRVLEDRLDYPTFFLQEDAWSFQLSSPVDVLTSSGLNIYVHDDERLEALYRHFWTQIKEGGELFISFITPPPLDGYESEWVVSSETAQHLLKQKIIFSDVLQAKWQSFKSSEETVRLLKKVGFSEVEIHYDSQHMFPLAIAKK